MGDKNKRYYFVVAEEILSRGGSRIPEWISSVLRFHSAALLSLYLSHHQFEEAADLVLYLLSHELHTKDVWLPYTQIDQLLASTTDEEIVWKEKLDCIRNLTEKHLGGLLVHVPDEQFEFEN